MRSIDEVFNCYEKNFVPINMPQYLTLQFPTKQKFFKQQCNLILF
jgi:hypothetical protein